MVKDIHQLPDNTAEAVHKPFILTFQCGNGLLFETVVKPPGLSSPCTMK
jgi:hypothetical protein